MLQTVVNITNLGSVKPRFAMIRNAGKTGNISGSPQNTSTAVGGQAWNVTTDSWDSPLNCANFGDYTTLLSTVCSGELSHLEIPKQLWVPNQKLDIVIFEYNLTAWATGQTISLNDKRYASNGFVYQAASAGTTGATEPTHTTGSVSDGGVSWTYLGKSDSTSEYDEVAAISHDMGDCDFRLDISGGGEVGIGNTASGFFLAKLDGEQIPFTGAPTFSAVQYQPDGTFVGNVALQTFEVGNFRNFTFDTTGMSDGNLVLVSISGDVKASSDAAAPVCKRIGGALNFQLVDSAAGQTTITDADKQQIAATVLAMGCEDVGTGTGQYTPAVPGSTLRDCSLGLGMKRAKSTCNDCC